MDLRARPLYDNPVDAPLFVNRERELGLLGRAVTNGLNALLLGERGSGRTSTLYRLRQNLQAEDITCVVVSGVRAETPSEVLAAVLDELEPALNSSHPKAASAEDIDRWPDSLTGQVPLRIYRHPIDRVASPGGSSSLEDALSDLRRAFARAESNQRFVVLLDTTDDPDVVHSLFGRFRDDLWQLPLTWVVTGALDRRQAYLTPPADAFFEVVVPLEEFNEGDALRLLQVRTRRDRVRTEILRNIFSLAGGSPRELLALARNVLIPHTSPISNIRSLEERHVQLSQLGRPAHMLAVEMEHLGPVSASDPRLLQRMGWTRPRVVQVLKELDQAGLVDMAEEKNGRGRPIKVYSLKSAEAAP